MNRLLFRTDPLTGNRTLRLPVIVGFSMVVGVALILLLETRPADTRHSEQLNLQTDPLIAAGERHLKVNPEVAELVGKPPAAAGVSSETPAVTHSAAPVATRSADPPRFSVATAPPADSRVRESRPTAGEAAGDTWFGTGTTGDWPRTDSSRTARPAQGSALVFKRLDEKEIQQRDSAVSEAEPGLAPGCIMEARLDTGIISGEPLPVILTLRENVYYKGTSVIPAGATLIGTATANFQARRIFVRVERLIIGDAEIGIQGEVTDGRGRAGLCDKYVDTARQQILPAFFAGILSEIGRAFSSRVVISNQADVNSLLPSLNETGAAVLTGAGSGLDSVAEVLAEKAKTAQAIIVVYPGQAVRVILEKKILLSALMRAPGRR